MTSWADLAAIKRTVGLAPLLHRYQVELRRSGRDQYRGCCPIHRGEGREAFHANLTRNIFHCFSCGADGIVLDSVAAMEGCTLREPAPAAAGGNGHLGRSAADALRRKVTGYEKRTMPSPLGFQLRGVDGAHPCLTPRGIDHRTAEEFEVGFCVGPGLFCGRLALPIHNKRGELVASCGRTLDGTEPRCRFPPGFTKSEILFNLLRAAAAREPTVLVVEGFFDCLKMHQAGIRSVLALMGAALYESQQPALEQFRRVILMLDGDAAGRRAGANIAARLQPRCSVWVIQLAAYTQPDQLPAETTRHVLEVHTTTPQYCAALGQAR